MLHETTFASRHGTCGGQLCKGLDFDGLVTHILRACSLCQSALDVVSFSCILQHS
jgi:hypothetical protein